MISLVVAASSNGVIGADGDLPWHLSDDLKRFKAITTGKPIVMGRKTYESIGRPLPNRTNIVLTRQSDFAAPGVVVVDSVEAALRAAGDAEDVMIIGGGQIYEAFLPMADRIYLTRVHAEVGGDARFPTLDPAEWTEISREEHAADERHDLAFSFCVLERTA